MNKNILLINPWIYDFKAYDSWVKPLGLLYIGTILEKYGYKIHLLDCLDHTLEYSQNLKFDKFGCGKYEYVEIPRPLLLESIPRRYKRYGIKEKTFEAYLNSIPAPDAILITSHMTYWYEGVFHAIKILKNKFPFSPVILGGIYATLCFSHARQYSRADYVWPGAFDNKCLNLINHLAGNNIEHCTVDLFSVRPAYHLYRQLKSVSIVTSLGCPYNCSYCASRLLQPVYSARAAIDVAKEIEFHYTQHNISHFAFYDDALLFNSGSHIEQIIDLLISRELTVNFYTPNGLHARFINLPLAKKMKKAGFKELRISLETSNPALQTKTGGKVTNAEFKQSISFLKEAGFKPNEIGIYIMLGIPDQKYEDMLETMEFVKKEGLKIKLINFSPIPGSKEWTKLPEEMQNKLEQEPLLQNDIAYLWTSKYLSWNENQNLKNIIYEIAKSCRK